MKNIFVVPVEDVQYLARQKFGRQLNADELYQVKKGVEFGLEYWEDVVKYALSDLEISKKQ
ncbi:MAG: hypothetical protein ISS47_04330 [Candidatus Omnitrophica bacterium]|nr:hypothetical protein [Candidatus Omnitrophota bacterium]